MENIKLPKENIPKILEVRELEKETKLETPVVEKVEEVKVGGQGQSSDEKVAEGIIGGVLAVGSVFPPTAPIVAPTAIATGVAGKATDLFSDSDNEGAKQVAKGLETVGFIGSAPSAAEKIASGEVGKNAAELAKKVSE